MSHRHPHTARAATGAAIVLAALQVSVGIASAAVTKIADVPRPGPISAFGGRLAWSDFDPATGRFRLMTRIDGATAAVPVAPRPVPFDVDLGPGPAGRTVAVYSRCAVDSSGASFDYLIYAYGRRCRVYEFDFAKGREIKLRTARPANASDYLPSIWKRSLAFARIVHRPGHGLRADIFVENLSSGRVQRQAGGPHRGVPFNGALRARGIPTGLDLQGQRLAFSWLWRDPGTQYQIALSRVNASNAKALARTAIGGTGGYMLQSPRLSGGYLYFVQVTIGDPGDGLTHPVCPSELAALCAGDFDGRYRLNGGRQSRATPSALDSLNSSLSIAADQGRLFSLLGGGNNYCPNEGAPHAQPCGLVSAGMPDWHDLPSRRR